MIEDGGDVGWLITGIVTGIVLFSSGYLYGQWITLRRSICGCRHSIVYHNPETGACNNHSSRYNSSQPCSCVSYDGAGPRSAFYFRKG